MKQNSYVNLGNLGLYRTFRLNGDRSATELVSDFNRFMVTVRFVGITERVALNIISTFNWYKREFAKVDADGKADIIGHIEISTAKIGAQRYLPTKYNEREYKYHRDMRAKKGEAKSVEILDSIFSVNVNEGDGKPVSAPKKTKSTLEGLGLLKYWKRESVGIEGHISYFNNFMRGCKDIPLHTTFKYEVSGILEDIKWRLYRTGTTDAMAFANHIEKIQGKLNAFNGTMLEKEFKDHEETAFNNFKDRIRTTETHDGLITLIEDFNVFRWAYRDPKNTFKYGEAFQQMKMKLEELESNVPDTGLTTKVV